MNINRTLINLNIIGVNAGPYFAVVKAGSECVCLCLGMDEEENTDRKLQIAMLCQKLEKIKRYYNDGDFFIFFIF